MSDQNRVKKVREIRISFPAHFPQTVRQKMPEPLQGKVFTQMCAKSAHHLPQKTRITLPGLGRCSPIDGLISSPTPNAGRVG